MIRVGVVGLGKMGLSHLSMIAAHPDVEIGGIADSSGYVLSVLGKYTGMPTYPSMTAMLKAERLDAVVISTPSHLHAPIVREAAEAGLHIFCEKPFCLDADEGRELAAHTTRLGLVTQVGYHNRFVAAFAEVKRLLDIGAVGPVSHVLAEAYGPVVLKPQGSSWRTRRAEGGGALYDYAAHPINLLNWYFGASTHARGTVLGRVFSTETDDEVMSTLGFADDVTAQLSVSWSDDSQRKMSTKVTVWGTHGRIYADRQEIQVYLRPGATLPEGYTAGWNVRYTTDLTDPVWFYLRGEEYSAQLDAWVRRIHAGAVEGLNDFGSASLTDATIAQMNRDAAGETPGPVAPERGSSRTRRRWGRRGRRRVPAGQAPADHTDDRTGITP